MNFGKLIVVALFLVAVTGCDITIDGNSVISSKGVPGSGVSDTETRDVTGFQKISIVGTGDVVVSVGGEDSLSISADDNLLELIESTVENGVLTIKPSEAISPKSDIEIDITIASLTGITVEGAAKFDVRNATGDRLDIESHGAGTVSATGTVTDVKIEINGAGKVKLEKLEAENVTVELNGACSGDVFASKSIDAELNGAGSLTVHGNPANVKKEVNGIGRIKIVE